MNQPNILCFVTDQLRADHLGCAGNPDVKTPHIDALAADGVRFENSYVSNPVCSPNRACLFTGQYPKSNGLRENGNALPEDALTLPRCLQGVGYQTFSSGKLHLAPYGIPPELPTPDSWKAESKELWNAKAAPFVVPYHGLDQVYFVGGHGHYNFGAHRNSLSPQVSDGYLRVHAAQDPGSNEEVWCSDVPKEQHYNTQIADKTIEFIDRRDADKPFFGWCSFPDPHHPFSPPEPWYSMYRGEDISINPAPDSGEALPEPLADFKESMQVADASLPECIAKNYGMISMVDHHIGRVIAHLKANDLYDNTIIVFLSDHGDYMGDHGMLRKALLPYDGVYRVPTIWRIPQGARGRTEALHGSVDLMPTLLDLVGAKIPDSVQGISQAPVLTNQHTQARTCAYAEYDDSPSGQRVRFLRDERYSFAYCYGADYGWLFDMQNDPQQQHNLFADDAFAELRNRLFQKLAKESIQADPWFPNKVSHA